ncbi:MAG: alpha-2-macroglobulin, partial [Blastocatellia bacterium]|nr:alpha-2-macroglobulin [Blastocatellia bacterium]
MKKLATFIILLICATAHAQQPDYDRLKAEAEKFYNEKSYSRALELYEKAGAMKLAPAEARWVEFRRADALWRAEAATNTADTTKLDKARERLMALVQLKEDAERDRVSAEASESLGDFWWARRDAQNWSEAWTNYQKALDWWAGERDLETARERYLQIVWKSVSPPWADSNYYPGSYGLPPLDVLENAAKIAQRPDDKSRAHFYLAVALRQYGEWEQRQRVPEEFEAALKAGKSSDWYDDALYQYGEWLVNNGRITQTDDGQWQQEPDFVRALEL